MSKPKLLDLDDQVWAALSLLCNAKSISYHESQAFFGIEMPSGLTMRLEPEVYDLLMERKFLRPDGDDVAVTESGQYWANRWLRLRKGRVPV